MFCAILDESKQLWHLVGEAPGYAIGPTPCRVAIDHLDSQPARGHSARCRADALPRVLRRDSLFFRVDVRFVLLFIKGKVEAILADQNLEPKLVVALLQELVSTPFGFSANGVKDLQRTSRHRRGAAVDRRAQGHCAWIV